MTSRTTSATRALLSAALVAVLTLTGAATAGAAAPTDGSSPFAGTRVEGADLKGSEQVPADAPTLTPGVYRDELTASEEGWRAYRVTRTAPGSTLHVSLTTQPGSYDAPGDDYGSEDLRLRLLAPDGTECWDNTSYVSDPSGGITPFVTVSGMVMGTYPGSDDMHEPACRATGTFTVLLGRDGPRKTLPAEIQVLEEPPVGKLSALPRPIENHPESKDLSAGRAEPVTGSRGFTGAPEITPGTWTDTLEPGQTRVYRVRVEYGQQARFTVNGPTGGFRYPSDGMDSLYIDGRLYAPDRQQVADSYGGTFYADSGTPSSVNTADVRYLNRYQDYDTRTSAMGGWYYYAVSVGDSELGAELKGQPIKVAFTVRVDGKASDEVDYDLTAGDWGDPAEASTSGPSTWLPWVAGGALGLAALAVGAWFGIRRLRS